MDGRTEQIDVRVTGMECTACSDRIERSLRRMPGIVQANVHYSLGMARVAYEPQQVTTVSIRSRIETLGFGAFMQLEAEEAARSEEQLLLRLRISFWCSLALTLPLLWTMVRHFGWTSGVPIPALLLEPWVQWLLATPVQFIIGRRFYFGAYRALRGRGANMDVLVALGTSAAYFYSHYMAVKALLAGVDSAAGHAHQPLYFETSAMIITVVLLGKMLETSAKKRTWSAVHRLQALQPAMAVRLGPDGSTERVESSRLRENDIVAVASGERLPADGALEEAAEKQAHLDESIVTGESEPVARNQGELLLCGSLNVGGPFTMRVVRAGERTTVARMARLVEEAQMAKPNVQRAADRVAAVFVPAIVVLAVGTFVMWSVLLRPGEIGAALQHAIAVLVIACPCSIGLATPISIMVGTGLALQRGIVFKNSAIIERMDRLDQLLLDKTGTITHGMPESVKPGAPRAIRALRRLGLEPAMVTGDRRSRALAVAKLSGLSRVYAEMTPAAKAELIRSLQRAGKQVVMVGDGVNDAPALATADVGIAVGSEIDVAVESADIVLMRGDLHAVADAIVIGRRTMRSVRQNLLFSLLYNACAIPLAITGALAPWVAGTAMAMSSLSVVANALRLRGAKL